ncbi:Leo1-like protein-domain-containing protein [Tuber indicum]|nr:Leo1-like protein-domain-containing protein [Tuber indicum]
MSSPGSVLSDIEASPLAASPERPTGNKYDRLFGSDNEGAVAHDEEAEASDDEDIGRKRRSRVTDNLDGVNDDEEEEEDGDRGLFGDDDDDEPEKKDLSDVESHASHDPGNDEQQTFRSIDVSLPRHACPDQGNDDLYLMRIPSTVNFQQQIFYPENFTMPKATEDSTVSPYTMATTTIRVRKSPANPSVLQSNARVVKWSDGSLSLQIASSPNLYDLTSKPLAPPQNSKTYDAAQDSHTYLLTTHESAGMLRFVGHVNTHLNLLPTSTSQANAEAVNRLQERLYQAQSTRGARGRGAQALEISDMRDPEAERKEAEKQHRDKEKLAKKAEAKKARASRNGTGADEDSRAAARRSYPRNSHTTRSKRDSPPIGGKGGRSKEDEYDLEDGFLEKSEDDEEDEMEESEDEGDRRRGHGKKRAVKKRIPSPEEEEEEEEEEAEFTDEERAPSRTVRAGKRRRVIDDDEEDDDDE